MSASLSPEESREIIKVCQSGRLYAIRDWISAGKSLRTAPETKKTILSVAIKTGFHSLVELIAPHETLEAKNQGLADAVRQKRLDLVDCSLRAVPRSKLFHSPTCFSAGNRELFNFSSIMEPMSSRDRGLPSQFGKKSGQPRVR